MELAEASVDQNEAGEGLFFLLETAVAAFDDFLHARKIVIAPFPANNKFAIPGFVHSPVFPHDHGSDCVRSLEMRNVEALDAARCLRQSERLLERLDNRLRAGLQDAEKLLEGVARVLFAQLEQGR